MSDFDLGLLIFALTLLVIMLRVPVGLAMLVMGGIGYALVAGWDPLLNTLKHSSYQRFSSYTLSVVPLFLLMGQFATRAGLNRALFQATRAWLGHLRGGLAIATVGGCAMFGAICGSSLATAATMSQVALPEMRRYGYSASLSTGTLAAGGTLGILIPPSVILVIYAIYTEQSIGHLFLAALVPGVIATLGYMIAVTLGGMRWRGLRRSLFGTAEITAMIFLILLGAEIFNAFLALTQMAVEVGMITPPFGLDLFVINAMAQGVPMAETYRGVLPFVASDVVRIAIILFVPWTALWAPGLWNG